MKRASGDLDAARECYEDVEQTARREADSNVVMSTLRNQGEILAIDQRRYEDARPFIERALELSVRIGDQWNRAELMGTSAVLAAARGDLAVAERLLADGDEHASRGDVFAIAYLQHCRARAYELARRTADADASYRLAAVTFSGSGFSRSVWCAQVYLDHAEFLAANGRAADAASRLAVAEEVLGPQIGYRAERIARLRQLVASARVM